MVCDHWRISGFSSYYFSFGSVEDKKAPLFSLRLCSCWLILEYIYFRWNSATFVYLWPKDACAGRNRPKQGMTSDVITFDQTWHHSVILKLCMRNKSFQRYADCPDRSDRLNWAWNACGIKCSEIGVKTLSKISPNYTWLRRGKSFPSWWCFLGRSNLLVIHQVKTKKITTVREVWIPDLNQRWWARAPGIWFNVPHLSSDTRASHAWRIISSSGHIPTTHSCPWRPSGM